MGSAGLGRGRFNDGRGDSRGRGAGNFRSNFSDRDSERNRGSSGGYPRSAPVKEHRPSPEFKEPSNGMYFSLLHKNCLKYFSHLPELLVLCSLIHFSFKYF